MTVAGICLILLGLAVGFGRGALVPFFKQSAEKGFGPTPSSSYGTAVVAIIALFLVVAGVVLLAGG